MRDTDRRVHSGRVAQHSIRWLWLCPVRLFSSGVSPSNALSAFTREGSNPRNTSCDRTVSFSSPRPGASNADAAKGAAFRDQEPNPAGERPLADADGETKETAVLTGWRQLPYDAWSAMVDAALEVSTR